MRRLLIHLAFALAALLSVHGAQAKGPRPHVSYHDRREAKRLFNQGHLAYRRGDYEEAILKWQESYDLSKEPLIFESIANAYERLGDAKSALEYLRQWRAKAPRREHAALDGRIENLETRVARLEEEQRKRREQEARRRQQEQEQQRRQRREQERLRQQRRQKEQAAGAGAATIAGWALVGTGAAAVVAGVVMDIVATVDRPDEQEACATAGDQLFCRDALRNDVIVSNQLAIAGDISWMAGAALAAGGAALLLLTRDPAADAGGDEDLDLASIHASPVVGPASAGLMVHGRF